MIRLVNRFSPSSSVPPSPPPASSSLSRESSTWTNSGFLWIPGKQWLSAFKTTQWSAPIVVGVSIGVAVAGFLLFIIQVRPQPSGSSPTGPTPRLSGCSCGGRLKPICNGDCPHRYRPRRSRLASRLGRRAGPSSCGHVPPRPPAPCSRVPLAPNWHRCMLPDRPESESGQPAPRRPPPTSHDRSPQSCCSWVAWPAVDGGRRPLSVSRFTGIRRRPEPTMTFSITQLFSGGTREAGSRLPL